MQVLRVAKGLARQTQSQLSYGQESPGLSILAAGTRITGMLETDGVLRIEGKVEGDLRAKGQVLVAPGGAVQGDIRTGLVTIAGEVHGNVTAGELVELKAGGTVEGDITAPRISVEEGGSVNGRLNVSRREKPNPVQLSVDASGSDQKGAVKTA
jgi:cytoskeletal protein CcmA (bactofilin family)